MRTAYFGHIFIPWCYYYPATHLLVRQCISDALPC
uniref:Uncharacterized protein n=1 Tax=Arundo donax TaxID=35708 RepID=A0A0A9A6W8_ARUDO